MRNTKRTLVACALLVGMATLPARPAAADVIPPGRPTDGYGSDDGYISAGATEHVAGNASDGSRVWWFVPDTLLDGTSAPVVVLLHGFQLPAPEIYGGHIEHLTRQGFIVVFPQFNLPITSILFDTDQNVMLARAIAATRTALTALGPQAGAVHLYGHSLGGLLAAAWTARGGPAPATVTMANPSTSSGGPFGIGTPIDWASLAPATTAPVVLLTGSDDDIAPPAQSLALSGALSGASYRVVHQATSDPHGTPALEADHMAPIQDDGGLPSWILDLIGGDGEEDALDFRYYYAALDAVLAGERRLTFDLGTWSDGQPVAPPVTLAEDPPPPRPDLHLRRADRTAWAGIGVVDPTGAGQVRTVRVRAGRAATFVARLVDPTGASSRVRGPAGGPRFTIRYVDAATGADRTAAVVAGTHELTPGGRLRIVVRPRAGLPVGASRTVTLSVTPAGVDSPADGVRAVTTVRA